MKNLWKDLDSLYPDMENPIDIIKEQSEYLEEGTNGLFYININEISKIGKSTVDALADNNLEGRFKYKVDICSRYLSEYSFKIMLIYYDISFYPLILNVPSEIGEHIMKKTSKIYLLDTGVRNYFTVEDEEEFNELLTVIFNCPKVRNVMKNMRAIIGEVSNQECE